VEHDAPQEPGSKLGLGASVFHQIIISNNSYAHDKQEGRKRGFNCVLYNLLPLLISSVKVVSCAGVAEDERRGWPLAGATHSTSQG